MLVDLALAVHFTCMLINAIYLVLGVKEQIIPVIALNGGFVLFNSWMLIHYTTKLLGVE